MAKLIKKTPIVVNDSRGFFTSRVIGTFINEGIGMLLEGVPAPTIEQASSQAGYPAPVLQLSDELNMKLMRKIRNAAREAESGASSGWDAHPAEVVIDRMLDEFQRPGRLEGAGFYEYADGKRTRLWPGLRDAFPVTGDPSQIDLRDLEERMLIIEALETVKCLDEGVKESVADANIGSIMGIGFPGWTGGVLQYINGYARRPGGVRRPRPRARPAATASASSRRRRWWRRPNAARSTPTSRRWSAPHNPGSPGPIAAAVLREVAEYPNSFVDLSPGQERIETGRYTLCLERSRLAATVQRQRFTADEVDEVLAEVRGRLRERGRHVTQWEVGSAAQPPGLVDRLLERGLTRDDDPVAIAVALDTAPPPAPPGLVARRIETFDEFLAAKEIQWEAFGAPPERIVEDRRQLPEEWEQVGARLMHGVWDDAMLICAGSCVPTPHGLALFGGATRPAARGRGAYRALVSARWQEAERLGAPALVTQAGAMSRPILERLGFVAVGRVDMLVDDFAAPDATAAAPGASSSHPPPGGIARCDPGGNRARRDRPYSATGGGYTSATYSSTLPRADAGGSPSSR